MIKKVLFVGLVLSGIGATAQIPLISLDSIPKTIQWKFGSSVPNLGSPNTFSSQLLKSFDIEIDVNAIKEKRSIMPVYSAISNDVMKVDTLGIRTKQYFEDI